MYYKILKSLDKVTVIQIEHSSQYGISIQFKDFNHENASIIIYKDGINKDISINGWTFPYIYNNIELMKGSDKDGGEYVHEISFEVLDPSGSIQKVEDKTLYGFKEALAIEYFYSLIYNISCCKDIKQYKNLYKYIIDNAYFSKRKKREEAIKVLNFIEDFTPQLSNLSDTEFLTDLKRKIDIKFKEAQEIIASADSPL